MDLSHERPAEGVFIRRRTDYVVGLDLGQSVDPTALAVLEHQTGVLDFNSPWERHTGLGELPQKKHEQVHVRHLERLPLGMSYPSIVQHVKMVMARPPLNGDTKTPPAKLVIDSTGVGR